MTSTIFDKNAYDDGIRDAIGDGADVVERYFEQAYQLGGPTARPPAQAAAWILGLLAVTISAIARYRCRVSSWRRYLSTLRCSHSAPKQRRPAKSRWASLAPFPRA